MKIHSSICVPSFPLLRVERALAFLKPGVFEKFEDGEQDRNGPCAVLFAGAVPILNHPRESAGKFKVVGLRSKEIDQ